MNDAVISEGGQEAPDTISSRSTWCTSASTGLADSGGWRWGGRVLRGGWGFSFKVNLEDHTVRLVNKTKRHAYTLPYKPDRESPDSADRGSGSESADTRSA